jgi:hypothetical protein
MVHVAAFFLCIAIVVFFLGYKQKEKLDAYSIAAVALLILLAGATVTFLGGTPYFPVATICIALIMLIHHAIIHRATDFSEERCSCAPFQCKDVSNHETWVVALVTAALISFFEV